MSTQSYLKDVVLLDYRNRGDETYASGNLGDMIQTIAMARLITRWLKIWEAVHRRRSGGGFLNISLLPRDELKSNLDPNALLILYGWHMHKNNTGSFSFPPATSSAIATSFHVSDDKMLTSEALTFLKKIGPIGCRDFSTLRKLRTRGVPSFYSGCCTLTLPPTPEDRQRHGSVAIDTIPPDPASSILSMWNIQNRCLTQKQLWTRALCILRLLRRSTTVYSSRLHVLYPCLAMKTRSVLQSPSGDLRLDWGAPGRWETARLYGENKRSYLQDSKQLEGQLAATLGKVLSGEKVTNAWRSVVLIHIAFCFDAGFVIPTLACANSLLVFNSELPLCLHFFHRGVLAVDMLEFHRRLQEKHPGVMLEYHECTDAECDRYTSHLPHVSAQTMERLWLHEKLPHVKRLIYIDGDMIVRGSIKPLLEVRVPVLAARNSLDNIMTSSSWNRGLSFTGNTSFNAGLMIMNLEALRNLDFSSFVKQTLRSQTANDQSILNLFCQGKHTELSSAWNFFAKESRDISSGVEPVILHFCGSKKPWNTRGIFMEEQWFRFKL